MTVVAVDCMGGDHGPQVILPACRRFLDSHAEARLLLVGRPEALQGFRHERAQVVAASEVIGMDDAIEVALTEAKHIAEAQGLTAELSDCRISVAFAGGSGWELLHDGLR